MRKNFVKNIKKYIVVIIFITMFPYFATMLIQYKEGIGWYDNDKYDLKILFENEGYTRKISIEQFLPYVLAYQMDAYEDEDELEKRAIVLRTLLYEFSDGKKYITSEDIGVNYYTYGQIKAKYGSNAEDVYEKYFAAVKNTEGETLESD